MRTVRACVVVVLLFAVTACAGGGQPVDLVNVTSVQPPSPVGVEENPETSTTAAAPVPNCNAKASYRPNGPLPPAGQMPASSTMAEIQSRGQLVAGVDQNTYLFGFRNPDTGALEGFDIDRVHEIAEAIFGTWENKVRYKVVTSAGRVPALEKGEVDVVVRTMTANCERWQRIAFSNIYYVTGQRLLVDKSSEVTSLSQLGGQKVCATKTSTSLDTIAKDAAKVVPVQVENWSDCLVMLQQGQVAAVSTDDNILAGLAAQDPSVKMVGQRFSEEPYGIGIPKDNIDMVRFVNGVLAKSIANGNWAASYGRWLGRTGEQVPEPPNPEYLNE